MGHVDLKPTVPEANSEVLRRLRVLDVAPFGALSLLAVRDDGGVIKDFRFISANAANRALIGLATEELIGSSLLEHFPQLVADGVFDIYCDVVECGNPAEFELRFEVDSREAWFQISAIPTAPEEIALTYTDVSENKRIQQVLSDLNVISSAETAIDQTIADILELGCRAFVCSHAFLSRVEDETYTVRGLVGDFPGVEIGSTLDLDQTLCAAVVKERTLLAFHDFEGDPSAAHPAMPKLDLGCYIGAPIIISGELFGTLSFSNPTARLRPFSKSEIEMARAMAETLAARLRLDRAKAELQSSRDELQFIFDNVPARIWYKDDQNRILRINKLAAESMNMTVEAATGADTYDLFPEMAHKYHQDDLQVINSGSPLMGIIEEYTPREGEHGWSLTDKVPLLDPRSRNNRLLVVAQDFTPLKNAQEELATKNHELERSNEDLQRFGAVISHDLKAPLRHMKILSELLIEVVSDNERALEFASMINDGAQKAQGMILALRDFSNVGKGAPDLARVDLDDVVRQCLDMMDVAIKDKSAQVNVGELPALHTDSLLCSQVIQNLVENALKYAGDDGLEIDISGEIRDGRAVISVTDNGPGIDPSFKEMVFEIFRRLEKDDKKIPGEGVGLATCRRIVERLGGEIWLDTDYSNGARFCFALPAAQ